MRVLADKVTSLDAGRSRCSQSWRRWPGASEHDRSAAVNMPSGIIFLLAVGFVSAAFAADTNEFILVKHQGRRQAYEWPITEARILASPEWNAAKTRIPLEPDQAWKVARGWFRKQGRSEPDLVAITIRPFAVAGTSTRPSPLEKRFYYRIDCIPGAFDSMVVIILMDGTVVEPRRIKDLPIDEIK